MPDMLVWTFGVHSVVLPISLIGLYRYSDRRERFAKAIGDTTELLARMRRRIATALEKELAQVFQRTEGEPRIVSPAGYTERPINPVHSDAFREAVRRFVDSDILVLVDYRQAYGAHNAWFSYTRALSWTVLGLSFWEAICVAFLGLAEKIFSIKAPDALAAWSLAPTAILIMVFFLCHVGLLRQSDVIHAKKRQYPEF